MDGLVIWMESFAHSDAENFDSIPYNSVSSCLSVVISLATKLTQRHVIGTVQFPCVHGECSIECHALVLQELQVYYLVRVTDYAETIL